MKEKLLKLLEDIHAILKDPAPECRLPQDSYILPSGDILALPREFGDSRFPYDADGLMIWAHTTGYIDACESTFTLFKTAHYNEDAVTVFFAGEKREDGYFDPISITGCDRALFEKEGICRYVVFSLRYAWYITETPDAVYALRLHISDDKRLHFSLCAVNTSDTEKEIYLAAYYEAMLRYIEHEGFFNRMTKYARRHENGSSVLTSFNMTFDSLTVCRTLEGQPTEIHQTSGKRGVLGFRGRNLTNAEAWKLGRFTEEKDRANTTDLPVHADIMHYSLAPDESVRIEYSLNRSTHADLDIAEFDRVEIDALPVIAEIDADLERMTAAEKSDFERMTVTFDDWHTDAVKAPVLNRFLKYVQKQVSFCALGKNYAGHLLGIRDVFQQLESSMLWQPERSREQMKRTFNYMLSTGRAPRQISFPPSEEVMPELDLRPYIDQGLWIIATVHSYLCWTGDYSILDEECGYYDCKDIFGPISRSADRDSIRDHLIRICDFLCSNIDEKTGCLHALWGDWNDALEGLGHTRREGLTFGDGCTVMASLQFYDNLRQMAEILDKEKYADKLEKYAKVREGIRDGLLRYAVVEKDGNKRVIHGWGDMRSYLVGSFEDYDGSDRISLTPNAFWALSGMHKVAPELKDTVVNTLTSLDSPYGLLTFDKSFPRGGWQVGRISTITPGTYENSCAYVHASMFGSMALFASGASREAWRQFEKSIVITHPNATLTTFVMPNSYCRAPEFDIDGDSMGDWYTGSGTVVIKELVRYGFGIQPQIDSLLLCAPAVMPATSASISFVLRGRSLTLRYKNAGEGKRRYLVNGKELESRFDEIMQTFTVTVAYDDLADGDVIEVVD